MKLSKRGYILAFIILLLGINYLFIEQPYKYQNTQEEPQLSTNAPQSSVGIEEPAYTLESTPPKPTIITPTLLETIKDQQPDESSLMGQLLINAKNEGFSIKKFDYKQTFNSYFIWLTKVDELETNIYIYGQNYNITSISLTTIGDIFVKPTPVELSQRLYYLANLYDTLTQEHIADESVPTIDQLLADMQVDSETHTLDTLIALHPITFAVENSKTAGITIKYPSDNPKAFLLLAQNKPYHEFPSRYLTFLEYLLAHNYKEDNLGYTSCGEELHRLVLKGSAQMGSTLYYKEFLYETSSKMEDTLKITYQIKDKELKNSIRFQTQLATLLVSDIKEVAAQLNPNTSKALSFEVFSFFNSNDKDKQPFTITNDENGYSVTAIIHGIIPQYDK